MTKKTRRPAGDYDAISLFEHQLYLALAKANPDFDAQEIIPDDIGAQPKGQMIEEVAAENAAALPSPFKLKLLADENIFRYNPLMLADLREAGFIVDDSAIGDNDPQVFRTAIATGKVLVTTDRDCEQNGDFDPALSPGIIVLPQRGGHFIQPCYTSAISFLATRLSRVPCWWFGKKAIFRRSGSLEIISLAPRLDREEPFRPAYKKAVYLYMPEDP